MYVKCQKINKQTSASHTGCGTSFCNAINERQRQASPLCKFQPMVLLNAKCCLLFWLIYTVKMATLRSPTIYYSFLPQQGTVRTNSVIRILKRSFEHWQRSFTGVRILRKSAWGHLRAAPTSTELLNIVTRLCILFYECDNFGKFSSY